MRKSMNSTATRNGVRMRLLASVSVVALLASAAEAYAAADADRPPLWIELGWQYEKVGGGQEAFAPSFVDAVVQAGFTSPTRFERTLPYGYGPEGKISFQPAGSNWIFSASVHYGRTKSKLHAHEQVDDKVVVTLAPLTERVITKYAARDSDTRVANTESHSILDFTVGRDVGLGMFGRNSSSAIHLGVRFAQFKRDSDINLLADPDYHFEYKYLHFGPFHKSVPLSEAHHTYTASVSGRHSFRGLGPSISWEASSVVSGDDPQDSQFTFDWGVNAGLLFGRQKAHTRHESMGSYFNLGNYRIPIMDQLYHNVSSSTRSKSVTVPNLGGFAGMSLRFPNAKVSLGYRADIFFNAIDGGIDARKTYNRGFYGPFASISIGLGD